MIGRLPLREHIAREMFADYKLYQSNWEKDRSYREWDEGTAFYTKAAKDPWFRRAEVAIEAYEGWHTG